MQRPVAALLLAAVVSGCAPSYPPAVQPARDTGAPRRSTVILGAVSAVTAASAIGFTIASALEKDAIERGGFATGKDIGTAADRGTSFNEAAFLSAALALGFAAAALAVYFYAWPSSRKDRTDDTARRLGELRF